MSDENPPREPGEDHPYTQDSVSGLLKLAVWYRSDRPRAERCFNMAVHLIEKKGGLFDPGLLETLRDYAKEFHAKGRPDEAKKLLALAEEVIASCPGSLYPDGTRIPWFKQPVFVNALPPLPAEFKASRAEMSSGCGCFFVAAFLFVLGCAGAGALLSVLPRELHGGWLDDIFGLGVLAFSLLGGLLWLWRERWQTRRERDESWFKLSDDAIEYHSPSRHVRYTWAEITDLRRDSESTSGSDESVDTLDIYGPRGKFRISARFFDEREIRLALGFVKLKTGK